MKGMMIIKVTLPEVILIFNNLIRLSQVVSLIPLRMIKLPKRWGIYLYQEKLLMIQIINPIGIKFNLGKNYHKNKYMNNLNVNL